MKKRYARLKTLIFCFLILLSAQTRAQVISENFEESVWIAATNASSGNFVIAATSANNTVSYFTGANSTGCTSSNTSPNSGTWLYSRITTSMATDSKLNKVRSSSHAYTLGSSSGYLITPILSGIATVSFWAAPAGNFVVGLNTNTTDTGTLNITMTSSNPTYGSAASAAPAGYTFATQSFAVSGSAGNTSMQQFTFTASFNGSVRLGFFNASGSNVYLDDIVITSTASTTPAITPSPSGLTGLTYNMASATDNTGGNPNEKQFTLTGSHLTDTNPVTVTAPAGFQISLTGTGSWTTAGSPTLSVSPSSGSISKTVYVRIDPTLVYSGGETPTGNITFSSADVASISSVSLSGSVVNLTPLSCPTTMTVSGVTYSGASFTWTNVASNNGYIVNLYKSGTPVKTDTVAQNTTSYSISGLSPLTAYTATVTVRGNGSTSGNSLECTSQVFTTLVAPPSGKITCWTEDFSTLAPTAVDNSNMCPAAGATSNELRFKTGVNYTNSCSDVFNLSLSSGIWSNATIISATDYDHSSGSRALAFYNGGSISLPTLDNPKTVTFYVYISSAPSASSTGRGFKLLVDGVARDTGIYVNNAALAVSTTTTPSYSSEANGTIRLPAGWNKVSININSTTQNTLTIQTIAGNSASNMIVDDVTVECSSMLFTAAPDVTGLNYVYGIGPSSIKTFTVTGTDLPNASGTITISNITSNFEVSLDNGTTWNSTGTATFTYSNYSFVKSVMVRLKAGLGVNSYSTTLAFTCPGYTKVMPTLSLSGKVTLLPQTLPCGEEVVLLNMKGTDESNILLDAVTGTNWTGTAQTKNNHFLLSKSTSLVSPTINLGDYELKNLTFYFQPSNATSMNLSLSCFGSGGSFSPAVYPGSVKSPYFITQDLSGTGYSGNFYLQLTDGNQTDVEMWDIKLTGVPKRQITLSSPSLSGFTSSSIDCSSQPQSLLILGTCMDDNSSLDFTSAYYEFSSDGISWATPTNNVSKLTYTGSFPVAGMKVYVRQKGTSSTSSFNAMESVTITNAGKGSASLVLSGTITPPADMQVPTSAAFSSLSGVASTRSISISGGMSCNALVVSSNCAGLTLSNCTGGTYAATTTFAVDDSLRTIYLKYTPGANLSCNLTLTSGSYVKTIPITWTGVTAITNGVATDNTAVSYAASSGFGTTNVWKAGALPDATVVTVSSTTFDVSMGNPTYGDFVAMTTAKLGDFNGTLYIRSKSGATSGTVTLTTAGGQTTTINVTVL